MSFICKYTHDTYKNLPIVASLV